MDGWESILSFWEHLFSGAFAVSFRECTSFGTLNAKVQFWEPGVFESFVRVVTVDGPNLAVGVTWEYMRFVLKMLLLANLITPKKSNIDTQNYHF